MMNSLVMLRNGDYTPTFSLSLSESLIQILLSISTQLLWVEMSHVHLSWLLFT